MNVSAKLDAGLKFIYSSTSVFKDYTNEGLGLEFLTQAFFSDDTDYIEIYPEIKNSIELDEVLNKLAKDGYLNKTEETKAVFYGNIDGRLFIENGGYASLKEKKEREIRKAVQDTLFLKITSFFVAIGSTGVLIVEILKYLKLLSSINLWTAFFVLLACNISGLLIWLIVLELKDRSNK